VARHRAAASATLGEIGGGALLGPGSADVGVSREDQRRRRLLTLAAVLGLPTAYLWWRILDGRPFDVFAFPDVDWLLVTPVLFFVMLAVLLVGSYTLSGRSPHELYRPEQLSERLSDVVGIDVVKDEVVRSLNLFLAHRTFHAATGGAVRRGLLFEGPPGTGKTLTAKAVAAEAGVPFLFASATSFQSSYYGATARKIRSYFVALRRAAEREGGPSGSSTSSTPSPAPGAAWSSPGWPAPSSRRHPRPPARSPRAPAPCSAAAQVRRGRGPSRARRPRRGSHAVPSAPPTWPARSSTSCSSSSSRSTVPRAGAAWRAAWSTWSTCTCRRRAGSASPR